MVRKTLGWAILIGLVLIIFNGLYRRSQLKRNFELVNAVIMNVGTKMGKSGDWNVDYQFVSKSGKVINATEGFMIYFEKKEGLIGRVVPCAYYQEDSTTSELLIYKHTWNQHGLNYPDSLNWHKEFFKEVIYSY